MLPEIDWTRPWYDSVRPAFERLSFDGDLLAAFNAGASALGLHNASGRPMRFVAQDRLPEASAYEEFIGATGCVPTRENLHDFFNGLVWLTFPRIKRQLNALQAAQIAQAGVGKSRGPARDGATIFDENCALLVVRDSSVGRALVEALRAHHWHAALFDQRAAFGRDAQVWLFGHALMEKLVVPRKAITAHTWVVWAGDDFFALPADAQRGWIDEQVAADLAAGEMHTARFTPLQVLGVPGWCDGQDAAFYADTSVFRPRRA
ncbi:hypothetical protein CR105_05475 [Massilia eurypsychrophila]|jgi:hypothetical protein|uniref:DUF3025 domain-containing protein n=1 Tax=Massilia eurypsychrophila TaxID=1485217 RepID=A0A2G8TKD7_9BURK|nr:DUF3025 domain-containing protein [Massilia eurypsychrophila]PIL46511.1 hypothetical protein CR105_05475 [Massilia eurypsychrophila]